MNQEVKDILNLRRKLFILEYAKAIGNAAEACREFDIPRSSFYDWKKAYDKEGKSGLIRKKPVARSHPRALKTVIVEKILYLRKSYQLGAKRIKYYLEHYHDITTSESSVTRTLEKYKINRLPKTDSKRTLHTKLTSKDTPGHHVQVDVKFITLRDVSGNKIKRFQYTAIDEATRIRALKIYSSHTQKNAIDFIDHVERKFPFRIHTIRTDRGHEFQNQLSRANIEHHIIHPHCPNENAGIERVNRTLKEDLDLTEVESFEHQTKLSKYSITFLSIIVCYH